MLLERAKLAGWYPAYHQYEDVNQNKLQRIRSDRDFLVTRSSECPKCGLKYFDRRHQQIDTWMYHYPCNHCDYQHYRAIYRHIFSPDPKVSSILVAPPIIKLNNSFGFSCEVKWCRMFSCCPPSSQPLGLLSSPVPSVSKIFYWPVQTDQSDALPTPGDNRWGSVSTWDKNTAKQQNTCHLSLPWLGQRVGGSQVRAVLASQQFQIIQSPSFSSRKKQLWNVECLVGTWHQVHHQDLPLVTCPHNRLEDSRTEI